MSLYNYDDGYGDYCCDPADGVWWNCLEDSEPFSEPVAEMLEEWSDLYRPVLQMLRLC